MPPLSDPRHQILVVHPVVIGPWSTRPRDRQVAHRIADLLALGLEVRLLPLETHPGTGAPAWLRSLGVEVVDSNDHVTTILAHRGPCYVTTTELSRRMAEAIADRADFVLDVDQLPSDAHRQSGYTLRATEAPGLATIVAAIEHTERQLIAASELVLAGSTGVATSVRRLDPTAATVVVAPTVPKPPRRPERGNGVIHTGRWCDEPGTPDEHALATFATSISALHLPDRSVSVLGEDSRPIARSATRNVEVLPHELGGTPLLGARAAIATRWYGPPVPGRLAELIGLGIAFVTTEHAARDTDLGRLGPIVVADDHVASIDALRRLLTDDTLHDEVTAGLHELGERFRPRRTGPELGEALGQAGWAVEHRTRADARTTLADPAEVAMSSRGGSLASMRREIEALEHTAVPGRVFDRDDAIHAQSVLTVDGRYRLLHDVHFTGIGPPPADPGSVDPLISILVPTWNTPVDTLAAAIESVRTQTASNWELCIVDDGSTSTDTLEVLDWYAGVDPGRIRVQRNTHNQGISGATNDALAMARGEWVGLLDHDDVLKPEAIAWVSAYVRACPDIDIWYSDEDKIGLDGRLCTPFLKPDWSPELQFAVNYVCHFLVSRRELMHRVGGFRSGFDGAQDYDLILRLTEATDRVGHIARPLYSWRMIEGSTAIDTGAKPKAHMAGHDAIAEALARRGLDATVVDGTFPTTHRVRYAHDPTTRITIVIPTRDRVDLLRNCLASVEANDCGLDHEVLVVDNDSSDRATLRYLAELEQRPNHQVVRYPHEFSFARQINLAARHATGDYLLILNNDATVQTPDWLISMLELAQRPDVGLVGAKLMFPPGSRDGRPQHEGIVLGMAGLAYNIDLGGYMGLDNHIRECASVTAACVMLRTSVFLEVGGMDERLRVAYNDVDFGVRVSEHGYRVLYTPYTVLEHPESASRNDLHPAEDENALVTRWGHKGDVRDPFINPHLEWMLPLFFRL